MSRSARGFRDGSDPAVGFTDDAFSPEAARETGTDDGSEAGFFSAASGLPGERHPSLTSPVYPVAVKQSGPAPELVHQKQQPAALQAVQRVQGKEQEQEPEAAQSGCLNRRCRVIREFIPHNTAIPAATTPRKIPETISIRFRKTCFCSDPVQPAAAPGGYLRTALSGLP